MGVFASCHQSYRHMPGTALITETHARKSPHLELLGEENFVGTLPFLYALRFCFRNWLALVPIQHSHSAELDKARGSNIVYFASAQASGWDPDVCQPTRTPNPKTQIQELMWETEWLHPVSRITLGPWLGFPRRSQSIRLLMLHI